MIRILTIIALLFATPAHSDALKASDLLNEENEIYEVFLNGIIRGISTTNAVSDDKYFCPPGKLALTVDTGRQAIKAALKFLPDWDETSPEILVLLGLKEIFPCPHS